MVSGFALVLWSRLGLIISNNRVKRALLCLIIFNACTWHTIMTVFTMITWAGQYGKTAAERPLLSVQRTVKRVNLTFEYIQIVFFNGQEILISSTYIYAAYIYLRDFSNLGSASTRAKVRRAMLLLLTIQTVVVVVDAAFITIDLLGLLEIKGMIHSFTYCVKLELELLVLTQLVEISRLGVPGLPSSLRMTGRSDAEAAVVAAAPVAAMGTAVRLGDEELAEKDSDPAREQIQRWEDQMMVRDAAKGVRVELTAQPLLPAVSESSNEGEKDRIRPAG